MRSDFGASLSAATGATPTRTRHTLQARVFILVIGLLPGFSKTHCHATRARVCWATLTCDDAHCARDASPGSSVSHSLFAAANGRLHWHAAAVRIPRMMRPRATHVLPVACQLARP